MAELGYKAGTGEFIGEYREGFILIEPGYKKVVIIESDVVDTKAGDGKILTLKLELQDGTKRTTIDRLNIRNPSEKAQIIGKATLDKIIDCIGHKGGVSDSKVLHGRPFEVNIIIEEFPTNRIDPATGALEVDPATGKTRINRSNKVSGYRKCGTATTPAPTPASGAPTSW